MPLENTIDMYTPRLMMRALDQVKVPKRFFHSTFFSRTFTHTTKEVELDVRKSKRRVAVYVSPIQDGVVVEREGFETRVTKPAYVKEMTTLRPQELETRAFGENIYNPMSPAQRAAQTLGEDLAMLDERLVRREEIMCAEAVLTGKVNVRGKGINVQVDFGYVDGVNKVIPAISWGNSDADPMRDMDTWRRNTVQRCGFLPNICIVGSEVAWAIINNPKLEERLNIINFQMGRIAPGGGNLAEGIMYYGEIMLPTGIVPLYSYDEWYTDPVTGEDVPMFPADTLLFGSTQVRSEFHYGLIQNLRSLQAASRFAFSWQKDDGSARFVQLESAPMPNLFEVDAFTVARVL